MTEGIPALSQNAAVYVYEGCVREAVHRLKYENRRSYARTLGRDAARFAGRWICGAGVERIVPMPMHPARRRQRGYNQALLLAEELSRQTGVPAEELLVRTRHTWPQQGLSREQRITNPAGSMEVPPELRAAAASCRTVLVVDDVYTTGASMETAAAALQSAGVRKVLGLTLCIAVPEENA